MTRLNIRPYVAMKRITLIGGTALLYFHQASSQRFGYQDILACIMKLEATSIR